jgi:hypothetical protein
MYYLLGTQIIVDVARGTDNSAARWLVRMDRVITSRDIKVSTMSWAAIEIEFQNLARVSELTRSQRVLRERIGRVFEKYRSLGSVLPVTDKAIQVWVKHLQDSIEYSDSAGTMRLIGFEEKLVLATAIAGWQDVPIVLVARHEVVHAHLRILGLEVRDPYDE